MSLGWSALAPPTSIATGWQFLELLDLYAKGRQFFDDDPTTTLEKFGVTEARLHIPGAVERVP